MSDKDGQNISWCVERATEDTSQISSYYKLECCYAMYVSFFKIGNYITVIHGLGCTGSHVSSINEKSNVTFLETTWILCFYYIVSAVDLYLQGRRRLKQYPTIK